MEVSQGSTGRDGDIVDLFRSTFAASEGAAEGAVVGGLARDLLDGTPPDDLRVFVVWEDERPIAAAIFTRLTFAKDARTAFILSPLAVATDRQRRGVGCTLLRRALAAPRQDGVDLAFTYGDPAFYGQVGFARADVERAPPPFPLSRPEGWLATSLNGEPCPRREGLAPAFRLLGIRSTGEARAASGWRQQRKTPPFGSVASGRRALGAPAGRSAQGMNSPVGRGVSAVSAGRIG